MATVPPPYYLKAVELGLVEPEAVIPREWIYDLCVLCPETPQDCMSFFRQHGATSEVDDNTYLALLACGFFRKTLDTNAVISLLVNRFSRSIYDSGLQNCLRQLTSEGPTGQRAHEICTDVLAPYQQLADKLLGDLPEPSEFSIWR
jgi:hypothetical protein